MMSLWKSRGVGVTTIALALVATVLAMIGTAFAQDPAAPAAVVDYASKVNKGDTAFMISSTVLVLMMTIPGLALFYGGLVRTKNMLAILMQVFAIVCMVCLIWVIYGYSLTFTNGGELNPYIGGFGKVFLSGVVYDPNVSYAATFSNGVYLPEFVFICFQMTFAAITPALIVGAFAERMKFSAVMVFVALWSTIVYFPIAHMVWYWGGPDFYWKDQTDAGYLWNLGALDFAGGTVVHINAGIAGLVGCLIMGRRVGFGKEAMPPHSLTLAMIGASLLWVGWFGFNVGSNLEANGVAGLAMINTFVATAGAALAWMFAEWIVKGKPSLLGIISGAIAGLVAVTPACGFSSPMGAIILGLVAGVVCFIFCTGVKNALGYDDTLDVFGVHCIGGIIGALGTGLLMNPEWGGTGWVDYTKEVAAAGTYDMVEQMKDQATAVGVTLLWSGGVSAVLFTVINLVFGLRPTPEAEREGLDISEHGERAYNY